MQRGGIDVGLYFLKALAEFALYLDVEALVLGILRSRSTNLFDWWLDLGGSVTLAAETVRSAINGEKTLYEVAQ